MPTSLRKQWRSSHDTILFVSQLPAGTVQILKAYGRQQHRRLKVGLIYDSKSKAQQQHVQELTEPVDFLIPCDFQSPSNMTKALAPYRDRLLAVTCRSEANMMRFRNLVPQVPYVRTPTQDSLSWSTNKLEMRRRFAAYDPSISPAYTVVTKAGAEELKKIETKVGFPCVVKPAGLAQSLLVTICFHPEELETALRKSFRKIRSLYRARGANEEPVVLVEQFLEGDMYSIDAYVDTRGHITWCPPCHVKTGRDVGFDDFFGYRQMTPTRLKAASVHQMEHATEQAVRALGLRSTTIHAELIRTEDGWKIIEVGARPGGFRVELYKLSYNIDHILNDVLTRIPEKTVVPRKIQGYTAAMKFFAPKEGVLVKLKGVKKAQELKSFHSIKVNKKLGDMCRYAKNGGYSVFNIILFNKSRSALLADIRRLEQMVEIVTKRS